MKRSAAVQMTYVYSRLTLRCVIKNKQIHQDIAASTLLLIKMEYVWNLWLFCIIIICCQSPWKIDSLFILFHSPCAKHFYRMWPIINHLFLMFVCRGVARNGLRRGFWGQKLPKEGVLKVRKRCGYTPERRFIRVLLKMTKKFGPMGGFWPPYPPLGYAPALRVW